MIEVEANQTLLKYYRPVQCAIAMMVAPKEFVFIRFDCQSNFSWKTTGEQQADGTIDLQDVKPS